MPDVTAVESTTVPRQADSPVTRPPRAWRDTLAPFVAAGALLVAWQVFAVVFSLPIYIAPTPAQVAHTLVTELPTLLRNFLPTAVESLVGFLLGNTIAILVAVVFVHSRRLE